jgi:hypothetical protein
VPMPKNLVLAGRPVSRPGAGGTTTRAGPRARADASPYPRRHEDQEDALAGIGRHGRRTGMRDEMARSGRELPRPEDATSWKEFQARCTAEQVLLRGSTGS